MSGKDLIDNSSDLIGGIVTASTTVALTNHMDSYASGIIGTVVGKIIEVGTKDLLNRFLSKREIERVKTVREMSLEKIEEKLKSGNQIRNDGFFDNGEKSNASEVFEGILLVAKSTYEEKKLEMLSNMFSNIAFDESISSAIANQLVKLADDLTYRQLLIIRCVGIGQISDEYGINIRKQDTYTEVTGIENVGIAIDTFNLYQRGCLSSKSVILCSAGINPSELSVTGYGALLWKLMDFEHRAPDELEIDILNFMNEHPVKVESQNR